MYKLFTWKNLIQPLDVGYLQMVVPAIYKKKTKQKQHTHTLHTNKNKHS